MTTPIDAANAIIAQQADEAKTLQDRVDLLRRALVGLVGVDTAEELDQMEAVMRLMPAPDADKAATVNAIHALKATL